MYKLLLTQAIAVLLGEADVVVDVPVDVPVDEAVEDPVEDAVDVLV